MRDDDHRSEIPEMIQLYSDSKPRIAERAWSDRPPGPVLGLVRPLSAEDLERAMAILAFMALTDEHEAEGQLLN